MPKPKKSSKKLKKKTGKAKKVLKRSANKKTAKPKKKKVSKTKKKVVSAVPKGYNTVTPYLIVNNANDAIEFYKKIFNAKEVLRMKQPEGQIRHAELKIGDAKIMLADEHLSMGIRSPLSVGGTAVTILVYVKDVDSTIDRAMASGGRIIRPIENMFYGDRVGTIEDPFGHRWHVSTHIEDVTPAQMKKRAAEVFGD